MVENDSTSVVKFTHEVNLSTALNILTINVNNTYHPTTVYHLFNIYGWKILPYKVWTSVYVLPEVHKSMSENREVSTKNNLIRCREMVQCPFL